jgi:uncharacterized protein
MASTVMPVETPQGRGRFFVDAAEHPSAILVLGHGAGGGIGAIDLELLAQGLPPLGTTVVRFEQPWRTAGRSGSAPPPKLDGAWCAALDWLVDQEWAQRQLLVGGRSAGARVACRTASQTNPAAVVCLAFPLHPPGRPEKSRVSELLAPSVPRLVLQGSKDSSALRKRFARQSARHAMSRSLSCPELITRSGSRAAVLRRSEQTTLHRLRATTQKAAPKRHPRRAERASQR